MLMQEREVRRLQQSWFKTTCICLCKILEWPTNSIMKVKNDHRSKFSNLRNWKEETWKNQGFNGIRTRDLRVTGALLYQLSYEATHWERGQFIEFISPVRSEMVRSIYEIIHFWTAVVDESEERPSQQVGKFAAMVVLHFHLQPQFKNELFHIYFANSIMVCYGISGVVNCKLSFFLPPRLQSAPESLLAGYSPWEREEFKRPAIPLPTKNITKKETAWFCW